MLTHLTYLFVTILPQRRRLVEWGVLVLYTTDRSPSELAAFASILDAQPAPVRDAFNYCLCLLMVEAGVMRLAETVPGENGELCVFETVIGDRFSVARSVISEEQEAIVVE